MTETRRDDGNGRAIPFQRSRPCQLQAINQASVSSRPEMATSTSSFSTRKPAMHSFYHRSFCSKPNLFLTDTINCNLLTTNATRSSNPTFSLIRSFVDSMSTLTLRTMSSMDSKHVTRTPACHVTINFRHQLHHKISVYWSTSTQPDNQICRMHMQRSVLL
jgi:hypothetical protein